MKVDTGLTRLLIFSQGSQGISLILSPDWLQQTPLQSCGCHMAASGPEPSQHDQSPTTQNKHSERHFERGCNRVLVQQRDRLT